MSNTLVIDAEGKNRVPFLRGILTRSLQEAGLSFEAAYQLASQIRDQLIDTDEITVEKLRNMVAQHLGKNFAEKYLERYQTQVEPKSIMYVENREGNLTPYSNSQYGRELEIIGLTPDQTHAIVAKMYQHLLDRGETTVSDDHLGHLTYRCLSQDRRYGPEIANRYLTWINFIRSGKPLILLIGGTAGGGKSTVATALASRLDIVRYQSTDMLREVMRMMIPERLLPVLHRSSFSAGESLPVELYSSNKKENKMLAGFRTQAHLLSVPCEAVIQRGLQERVSLLLEGVHVQPSLLEQIPQDHEAVIVHVMLAILKKKELKKRIKGRGGKNPHRRSERYLDNFEAIWHLQSHLLDEADQHDVPIVVNNNKDTAIREIMKIVVDSLMKDFSTTPVKVFGTNSMPHCS